VDKFNHLMKMIQR